MSIKDSVESNIPLFLASAILTGFAGGWGSHLAVTANQQSYVDVVPKGSYVLKEEIETGKSISYVPIAKLQLSESQRLAAKKNFVDLTKDGGLERPYFTAIGFMHNAAAKSCKDRATEVAKEQNLIFQPTEEGTEMFATGGKYQALIHCQAKMVFVVGPDRSTADSLRQTIVAGMQSE